MEVLEGNFKKTTQMYARRTAFLTKRRRRLTAEYGRGVLEARRRKQYREVVNTLIFKTRILKTRFYMKEIGLASARDRRLWRLSFAKKKLLDV